MHRFARNTLALVLTSAVPNAAWGTTITLPWVVEFPTVITNPAPPRLVDVSTPAISGTYRTTSGGIDAPGLDVRAGFNVNASATPASAAFRMPVEIAIEAPERVRPGQLVNLQTTFRPINTPANPAFYRVHGELEFDTDLRLEVQSDTFGVDVNETIDLPDRIEQDAVTLQFGGSGGFEAEDEDFRQVAGRNSFAEDAFGQSLRPRGTLTQGYQFEAIDTIDGVEAAVDLFDLAAALFPPLAPVAAVVDLDVGGGFDILVGNTLTTNLAVAYYTFPGLDNDGFVFDQIDLNRGGAGASVRVPDTLENGDTFDVFFSALGLGFNVLSELGLQGNFDLDLNLDLPFAEPSLELLSLDVGDPFIFDQDLTTFQYIQFLAEFMDPADAVLSMLVDDGSFQEPLEPEDILGPPGEDGPLVASLAAGELGPGAPLDLGLSFDAPGAAPPPLPVLTVEDTAPVPLPGAVLMLATGLCALAGAARARRRRV